MLALASNLGVTYTGSFTGANDEASGSPGTGPECGRGIPTPTSSHRHRSRLLAGVIGEPSGLHGRARTESGKATYKEAHRESVLPAFCSIAEIVAGRVFHSFIGVELVVVNDT